MMKNIVFVIVVSLISYFGICGTVSRSGWNQGDLADLLLTNVDVQLNHIGAGVSLVTFNTNANPDVTGSASAVLGGVFHSIQVTQVSANMVGLGTQPVHKYRQYLFQVNASGVVSVNAGLSVSSSAFVTAPVRKNNYVPFALLTVYTASNALVPGITVLSSPSINTTVQYIQSMQTGRSGLGSYRY